MSSDNDEGATYPDVDVTLRFSDSDDNPVEGLTVKLYCDHGILGGGFLSEERTDGRGEVEYCVESWQTYAVWVEHSEFDEIHVQGGDKTFEFTWDSGDAENDDDE